MAITNDNVFARDQPLSDSLVPTQETMEYLCPFIYAQMFRTSTGVFTLISGRE